MSPSLAHFSGIPPLFITFEGGEGVGKSTQIRLLHAALLGAEIPVVLTREPGGCSNADLLRKLLVEGEHDRWDGLSEALLYSAARNEHLRTVIRPNLVQGNWILCDRFADSTVVYQGEGRGLSLQLLQQLNQVVVGNTWPDLTVVLDMPSPDGLFRARGRQENMFENRFENLHDSFHERVRRGFLKIAEENPRRCRVVDASGAPDDVHSRVLGVLYDFVRERAA